VKREKTPTVLHKEYKQRVFRFSLYFIIGLLLVTLPAFAASPIVSLFNKILIFALLAMSLDLLVGYAGLWAFGHAAFFAIAAYTTGILIVRYHITSFWLSAPAGVFMAVLAACIFGLIALRVSGIYFLLITFALGQLVFGIANTSAGKLGELTGASDGLAGVPYPNLGLSFSPTGYYYFVLVIFIICTILLYLITKSSFGSSLQGIRESEIRMRSLGYNTWLYKYIAFVVAGLFAGVAGVLYIHFNGLVHPPDASLSNTGLLWLMLIVGGVGKLWGAAIGSGVVLGLQYFISGITPERWPLILGACFVAVILIRRWRFLIKLPNLWEMGRQYYKHVKG
jgi:branched-chain amino acid transport system permease protein